MTENELDQVFQALSHGARRAILIHIQKTPATSTELKRLFSTGMSEMAVNNHISVLERARLIAKERSEDVHGKLCTYYAEPIDDAVDYLIENKLLAPV